MKEDQILFVDLGPAEGRGYGITTGLGLKNVFLRREQFRRADDATFCLLVARDVVVTKIRNQRTLLQRNHLEPSPVALNQLKRLAQQATAAESLDSLLGIEGNASRVYFEHFGGMLKTRVGEERSDMPSTSTAATVVRHVIRSMRCCCSPTRC